jgi:hypothetical protein
MHAPCSNAPWVGKRKSNGRRGNSVCGLVSRWWPGRGSSRREVVRAGVVGVVLVLAAVAWGFWPESDAKDKQDQRIAQERAAALEELAGRESYEQVSGDYLVMLKEIRGVLDERVPELEWSRSEARGIAEGLCERPYEYVKDARIGVFDVGEARGAIREELWSGVERQVIDVAAQHGFTGVSVRRDEPESRKLVIKDGIGGSVELESAVNSTLAVYGSCHLKVKSS